MERIRELAWPLIVVAFLAGIGVGLVLGWQVWPVSWYNTDPSDLRMEHQTDYVVMTANALAVTGDLEAARRRLLELTDKNTTWPQVVSLVYSVAEEQEEAGDEATALRTRRLAEALNMPSVESEPFEPPEKRIASPPRWLLMTLGGMAFVVALGIVAWLLLRELGGGEPMQEEAPSFDEGEESAQGPVEPQVEAVSAPWEDEEAAEETPVEQPQPEGAQVTQQTPAEEAHRSPGEGAETVAPQDDDWMAQALPSTSAQEESSTEVPPGALGAFDTTYTFGDDDFDRSFSIESEGGEFLGECGLSISDIVDIQDAQRVDAFEVWLFDKGDIRTVSKILVSEYAHEDESLREELGAKGDLVPAEEGLAFSLDTLSLQVQVTVEELRYLSAEDMPEGIFSRLSLRMVVTEGE